MKKKALIVDGQIGESFNEACSLVGQDPNLVSEFLMIFITETTKGNYAFFRLKNRCPLYWTCQERDLYDI